MLSSYQLAIASAIVLPGFAAAGGPLHNIPWNPPSSPPANTRGTNQYGFNDCFNYPDSSTSKCQTMWINGLDDFCLFGPPVKEAVGTSEHYQVSYCLKAGHGTRLFPKGTITGASFVRTPDYVQITGTGDFTKINVPKGDEGGELDPYGPDVQGNPIGGLVYGYGPDGKTVQQFVQWTEFLSDKEFCIRACFTDRLHCEHIYDEMGCYWNMPATYKTGTFESCKADDAQPMGIYTLSNGVVSTFHQGDKKTPDPHPEPSSSQCSKKSTLAVATYGATTTSKSGTKVTTTAKSTSTSTKKTTTSTKKTTTTTSTKKATTTTTKKATTTSTKKATTTSTKKATSTSTKKTSTSSKKTTSTKAAAASAKSQVRARDVMGLGERGVLYDDGFLDENHFE
ncbi:hypothetical protein BT69DRAFT_1347994 [Atractiella rhizophila]|nr:hypothetical protein BT69DRAFT_1347994 [Atractiella rhizophila]